MLHLLLIVKLQLALLVVYQVVEYYVTRVRASCEIL